ncbi:hypothetical protein GCM10023230_16440 [Flavobacterium hankyongi]|uniref:Uncharacterized protein n=1 Tax=Flavobacterium hankyongi TaxID=1176532 RepID=A0ABP8ZXG3_9FLAO
MRKNKKSNVLRKAKHKSQNENRSSFSGKVNVFANLIKRFKEKPWETVMLLYRFYNLIQFIIKLITALTLF